MDKGCNNNVSVHLINKMNYSPSTSRVSVMVMYNTLSLMRERLIIVSCSVVVYKQK